MQPKHIVVIEDDPDILYVEHFLLIQAGYRVTTLAEVQSLEALLELKADCFILDEQLPIVSGHIICIYLRSKPQAAHIPVILVSAHPKLDDYAGICDADGWVRKPFDTNDFLEEVRKCLAEREQVNTFQQR